ncbi:MAG: hypothetical protein AAF587_02270 [Bacteroidota bacterium]
MKNLKFIIPVFILGSFLMSCQGENNHPHNSPTLLKEQVENDYTVALANAVAQLQPYSIDMGDQKILCKPSISIKKNSVEYDSQFYLLKKDSLIKINIK